MTHPGQWLQPRHGSRETFEKDFSAIAQSQMDVLCPGCRQAVRLTRKAPTGKSGGWCPRCNRGVGA